MPDSKKVSLEEVKEVQQQADCLFNRQQIEQAIDQLAVRLRAEIADSNPVLLVIMRGGMMFASSLAQRLPFPLELEYLHASRYGDALSGGGLDWIVKPPASIAGRQVLLIDDIYDLGRTLLDVREACSALGAANVKTAVLVNKIHDRKNDPSFVPEYCCLTVPDRYVFGYGMDYKGYLRNLDGIYAVKDL